MALEQRLRDLRGCLRDAETVAILLQDDPDPDGLASALALRKLLGRNAQTAPIVSFGTVHRPENEAMCRLLEIDVKKVSEESLHRFDKLVCVDCQPSFFKGRRIVPDVILDHHPRVAEGAKNAESRPLFEDIREDLGALSTLMLQYLQAAKCEISRRLATALLYGIKTDTLHLNRETSSADLEAFVYLYPRANGNWLRKIERPELPLSYLERLRSGLKFLRSENGVVILPIGEIEHDEWVAQAADFALQVEGSEWAFGCGLQDDRLLVSGRNCGYVQHCGDLFKDLFDALGCAGGHRTMAKAIIPKSAWTKRFGSKALTQTGLAKTLLGLIEKALLKAELSDDGLEADLALS